MPDRPPTDAEFFDDRIVDCAVATNHNSSQDYQAAAALRLTGWLMLAGVALQLAVFGYAILRSE